MLWPSVDTFKRQKLEKHDKFTAVRWWDDLSRLHYSGVIMATIASQITSLAIVYSIVYSDADQRKHQSSASLAFVREIHRLPVNSPHKRPVTRKMFPFDDVIMLTTWMGTSILAPTMAAEPSLYKVHRANLIRDHGFWKPFSLPASWGHQQQQYWLCRIPSKQITW